jgi:hypothetical protein
MVIGWHLGSCGGVSKTRRGLGWIGLGWVEVGWVILLVRLNSVGLDWFWFWVDA